MFYRAKLKATSGGGEWGNTTIEVHPLDANLISSERPNGKHALLLDLDINSYYVPSSTSGHAHLYLDTNLTTEGLTEVIAVLKKYGIVQQGIYNQVSTRGSLTLRPPGVKKGEYPDDEGLELYKESLKQEKLVAGPIVGGYVQPIEKNPHDLISTTWQGELNSLSINKKVSEAIGHYKEHDFQEKFTIQVTDEFFYDFLNRLCAILSAGSVEAYPGDNINIDMYIKCKGHKIITVVHALDINAKELTFHKSDYENGPKSWPKWEEFIKQIGEMNV